MKRIFLAEKVSNENLKEDLLESPNEGKKEVSENQKTVIKENSDLTDKNVTDLCLDINPNTNLIQFIYSFLIFFIN